MPLPKPADTTGQSPAQRALQAMSDLTGYISTQVYVPYRPPVNGAYQYGHQLGPAEEEFRREIRALKGLALNRYVNSDEKVHRNLYVFSRSLLPSIPKFNDLPRPASAAT